MEILTSHAKNLSLNIISPTTNIVTYSDFAEYDGIPIRRGWKEAGGRPKQ